MKFQLIAFALFILSYTGSGSKNIQFLPLSTGEQVNHQYYILSYNEDTEQANWVLYKLTSDMLAGETERDGNFRNDPLVATKSASTKDYTNSGYDRGHLCPAADMKFNEKAMYESFYMSNISPQLPGFNRGIWKELETQVRDWARGKDSLYIVTGPIFDETVESIGTNKVRIPVAFYKILYGPEKKEMIAFNMPNKASESPLETFTSTVDNLEEITGIDFFSQLPDNMEEQLESKVNTADWFVSPLATSLATKFENRDIWLVIGIVLVILFMYLLIRKSNKR